MRAHAKHHLTKDIQRQIFIQDLLDKGITEIKGIDINNAGYEELKFELVLANIREIDITADSNRWY